MGDRRDRIRSVLGAGAIAGLCAAGMALYGAPGALAAGSPAVTLAATSAVRHTGAILHGRINPESAATTYRFAYGPTPALGSFAPAAPAPIGKGAQLVAVKAAVTGLEPGTTYYFELTATNAAGTSSTPAGMFKTTGSLPPGPTTGGASGIGRYGATLTGTIVPNNAPTSYYFQYGLTTAYGLQTAPQVLGPGTAPVSVNTVLAGLEPGVAFHYRLVAAHGAVATSYGADQSFTTLPFPRPRPSLTARITPARERTRPFRFAATGRVGVPAGTPTALACTGLVRIAVMDGHTRVGYATAPLGASCTYSVSTRLGQLPGRQRNDRQVGLRAGVRYLGDPYLAPSAVLRRAVVVLPRPRLARG